MSQPLAEVCDQLIKDTHGELCAHIFSTLGEHGRLTIHILAIHSKTPLRRLRHGLGILLEQQLIQRFMPNEDSGGPIFYQADWSNAYNIARHDTIMELVKERYGEGAGQVVNGVLQSGIARVGDVADSYDFSAVTKRNSGIDTVDGMINGAAKTNGQTTQPEPVIKSIGELHKILRILLNANILVKASPRSYLPPADLQEQIDEQIISERFPDRKITGAKKAREFKQAVFTLKRQLREDDEYSESRDLGPTTTISSSTKPNKRAKLNGHVPNGQHCHAIDQSVRMITNELVVRVNHTRCILALRSRRLKLMAKRYFGGVTATVYGALLETLEDKCTAARDDLWLAGEDDEAQEPPQPKSNIAEVADLLDSRLDLASSIKGLAPEQMATGKNGKKRVHEFAELGVKDEDEDDDDDDQQPSSLTSYKDRAKRIQHVQAHLTILEEHGHRFCQHIGQSEWRVDFSAITQTLVQAEIDTTVSARYEREHLRIIRMLRERGKLDEKQIAGCALAAIKDIRGILTKLQFDGYLDAQELPKDNTRHPTRTLYLWFFDELRVRHMLLQQCYQTMARTLQRVQVERIRFRDIIDKIQRTDVGGREEKLQEAEKARLRVWREVEERLLTQVARLDDTVAVLRDFDGKDTSLAV